jgi:hypothetical protein
MVQVSEFCDGLMVSSAIVQFCSVLFYFSSAMVQFTSVLVQCPVLFSSVLF